MVISAAGPGAGGLPVRLRRPGRRRGQPVALPVARRHSRALVGPLAFARSHACPHALAYAGALDLGARQPGGASLDGAVLTALHDRLDDTQVQSCVIVRDGTIVDEYFKEGYDETTLFTLQSCSKSVTSALVGIAIEQGYLPGVDVPIAGYFPQLLEAEDERLQDITIRHLLTHTSGLQSTDSSLWSQWRASDDWVAFLFERPLAAAAGDHL